jgi:hypothetical protein
MAIVRRSTDLDATWARAWTADDVADLASVVGTGVEDAHHGDIAYVTATSSYYLFMDDGTWFELTTGGGGIDQLTGDVTAGPGSGSEVATIANGAVTLAKIADAAANSKLLGSGAAGAGNPYEELTLGTGLSMSGTTLNATGGSANPLTVGVTVDGGGSAITTGVKGYIQCPIAGTIASWTLLADQAGDVEFDVLLDDFASYPPTTSIVASAPPEIVSPADSATDSTLTGWTTAVTAGDVFGFEVVSAATIERVTLQLTVTP